MNPINRKPLAVATALAVGSACALADGSVVAGRIYRLHNEAINRGEVAAAMAYLTSDVRYIAGPGCTPAKPCVGTAAVGQGFVEWAVAKKLLVGLDWKDLPEYGGAYRARVEVSWPGIESFGGAKRIVGVDAYTVRLDRIDSLTFTPDMEDPQTLVYFNAVR